MTTANVTTQQEEWRDIPGYEGIYQVSNLGRMKSMDRIDPLGRHRRERLKVPTPSQFGYLLVTVCKNAEAKRCSLHSLVMLAFVGERPHGYDINHINGDKTDNSVANLEYCSTSHNIAHSYANGFQVSIKGERQHNAKLNEDTVREIRRRHENGEQQKTLAGEYAVSTTVIWNIVHRHTWKHVA